MATQTSKKKRSKKKKPIPSGDGSQGHDQVKESIPITPDLMDKNPGSSHKLLMEHIETPSLADTGFQQPYQRQHEDGEHQRESEIQISAQGQITNDGRKSKKKHKKKASSQSMNPHPDVLASESSTNEDKSFTFEEQVEWCIGQLELGLHRRDATKAQKDSNTKNIRTLRSLRVPIPRKRQLMRSLFGDYRSKMMATPLPGASAGAKGPCLSVVEREVAEDCGKFFKYKHSHTELINDIEGHCGCSEPFCFDFVINNK